MNGNHNIQARSIALAGLFQAVHLVQQTSQGKTRCPDATHASVASIFATDAESVAMVYGGLPFLRVGLEVLDSQLDHARAHRDLELTGYALTLLHLERKLSRNRAMLERLSAGIAQVRQQAAYSGEHGPEVIAALADLYQQTISTLTPRILVRGEPGILSSQNAQQVIRALLLAGIRAAVLWRQCGGSRWRLIFERKAMLECVRSLREEARTGRV